MAVGWVINGSGVHQITQTKAQTREATIQFASIAPLEPISGISIHNLKVVTSLVQSWIEQIKSLATLKWTRLRNTGLVLRIQNSGLPVLKCGA